MQRTIDKQDLITHLLKFTAISFLVIDKCAVPIATIRGTCSYGNIAAGVGKFAVVTPILAVLPNPPWPMAIVAPSGR